MPSARPSRRTALPLLSAALLAAASLLAACGGGGGGATPDPVHVSTILPSSGPAVGGTTATLTGTGLSAGDTVTFDGATATVTAASATSLTISTPSHAAGSATITVTAPDGRSFTWPGAFTFVAGPAITSVQPGSVGTAGQAILINGSGFAPGAQVQVGGVAAATTVLSASQLAVGAPAHAAGPVDVRVLNLDGQQAVLPGGLNYSDAPPPPPPPGPPTLSGATPPAGPEAGGTSVALAGTNFDGHVVVTFGGVQASVSAVTATQVTVVTPPHLAGAVDVTATNPDQQSATLAAGFTYQAAQPPPAPAVAGVTPPSGSAAGGDIVSVTGSNFLAGATVTFGGTAAAVISTAANTLTVTTPAHATGAVAVAVRNPDGQTGSLAGAFTYTAAPPTIASLNPASGPASGGTGVTITGTGFTAGATVTFGGVAASGVAFVSATQLTAGAPAHAEGAVDVAVTVPGAGTATRAAGFTYLPAGGIPAPVATGLTPPTGVFGAVTTVDIAGTNFFTGLTVTFGGVPATVLGQVRPDGVTVASPSTVRGVVDVVVTNPDLQSTTLTRAFTFTDPPPVITTLDKFGSPTAGGDLLLIVGTGLDRAATVTFGGTPGTGLLWDAGLNALRVTIPAHAEGFVDVVVTNLDGQFDTFAGFHYGPPPAITSFTPGIGKKGDTVTITGTNFDAAGKMSVAFGGVAATKISQTATTVVVTVPKLNPGFYTLVVVNSDTQFGVSTGQYQVQ